MNDRKPKIISLSFDFSLLFPALFLVGIGIVMVYSASSTLATDKFSDSNFFLKKQVIFALVGILLLVICRHTPYRIYRSLSYGFLTVSFVALLLIPLTDLGQSAGGAARWLQFKGLSFQPVELVKFSLIVYLAYSLSKKQDKIREFSIGFVPHVMVLCVFAVLILLQPDFGSVVILATLTWIMLFVGGVRISHLSTALLVLVPVIAWLATETYRWKRIMSFLDPWKYPTAGGYQIIHSLMAFGSGGIWGAGIGQSYQKLKYLPEPHTDFIFSVIGEELGLWGVCLVLGLYTLLLWRGISIAKNQSDLFGAYLAVGLTAALGLQVCINMGVAVGLLPTKGLTLPFISYGGTSLVLDMAWVGILMNIGASQTQ